MAQTLNPAEAFGEEIGMEGISVIHSLCPLASLYSSLLTKSRQVFRVCAIPTCCGLLAAAERVRASAPLLTGCPGVLGNRRRRLRWGF